MTSSVVLIVLFGALLHATWNTIVKSGTDKYLNAVLVVGGSGVIALMILPFVSLPDQASWPFLLMSMVLQTIYLFLVAAAYSSGDMSLAYPLMRGTPPLLVALIAGPLIGEVLALPQWLAICLISSGVLVMAFDRKRISAGLGSAENRRRTITLALINALFIAGYTLVDGIGVRRSGDPLAYTLWVFLLNALPVVLWGYWKYGRSLNRQLLKRGHLALIGGAGTLGSYGLALWAMTMAPVAMVAALRETSILFALVLSVILLGEKIGPMRIAGALLIVSGTMLMRML